MSIKNSSFVFRLFSMFILFALLFCATGVTPAQAGGGPLHVKPAATGTGDCLSWANACTLQTALASAGVNNPVWVMAGAYKPTTGTDRSATFQLTSGASVYGGFAGAETALDQRDPLAHVTILSGGIGAAGNSDNSYHVVTGVTDATLDGFTITAGNANGAFPDYRGGGMYNPDGSNPTLANLIFLENSANFGGGLYNSSGSPTLTNITFIRNSATVYGGGVYNYESNPTLTNVTFSDNTATDSGGGMLNRENSNPTLTNVTFSGNTTTGDGGGISNFSSNPTIRNTIFWGNTAPVGAQISDSGGSIPIVSDSVVQGGYVGGVNIIISDPRLGTLADHGGFTLTIPLLENSSAIDTGDDTVCPATDQRGMPRPQGAQCDIGAYEFAPVVIYAPLADFNGDHKTDVAVFRPTNGTWYINGQGSVAYGQIGDIPVPADYNGDGKAEIAVFRPTTSTWYIRGQGSFVYGQPGDVPVVADYNGDGKADIAVFRPTNSTWYVRGIGSFVYGTVGDIPVVADYDGDGKADIAVFRPTNSTWYLYGIGPRVYGTVGDIPVVADYDGDKKADIAVFRPSNNTWYLYGIGPRVYGATGDLPVIGDYTGDGKADIAVFRSTNNTWYIYGVGPSVYGTIGDIPV